MTRRDYLSAIDILTRLADHMPRWASRLTLRISVVRMQRVQEISAGDARAEGIQVPAPTASLSDFEHDCVVAYRNLWEATYPGSWHRNEWVWALSFQVIKANVDAVLNQAA